MRPSPRLSSRLPMSPPSPNATLGGLALVPAAITAESHRRIDAAHAAPTLRTPAVGVEQTNRHVSGPIGETPLVERLLTTLANDLRSEIDRRRPVSRRLRDRQPARVVLSAAKATQSLFRRVATASGRATMTSLVRPAEAASQWATDVRPQVAKRWQAAATYSRTLANRVDRLRADWRERGRLAVATVTERVRDTTAAAASPAVAADPMGWRTARAVLRRSRRVGVRVVARVGETAALVISGAAAFVHDLRLPAS